ncbi:MAG: narK2 [Frankiales bacterium]|nr:narK2 [Frankiales bacterium]
MSATQDAAESLDSGGRPAVTPRPNLMLGLAMLGFAVDCWAWALLSPLGPRFRTDLGLSSFQQSLLVAVPVVVGALGRIPAGALTDRYGARIMFPAVSLATVVPVLFLGLVGHESYAALLVGGFFLGLGGTTFAVGVPFVNAWFAPERRGFAIGVFGAGMGGTAISALTTVRLSSAHGIEAPFLLVAAVLTVYGLLAAALLRDVPGRLISTEPAVRRLLTTLRLPVTWKTATLYAVGFGGFVAFSVYLPTYLKTAYGLSAADAANRMAGFVLVAVLLRPLGGWLSDRLRPTSVLGVAFSVVAVLAAVQSATPDLAPIGTLAFLTMAGALGAASGAVFALVARLAPEGTVGSVSGVVGAAGGLGGFVPPLLMGSIYGSSGSYAVGLLLLAGVAALATAFSLTVVRRGGTA